MNQATRAKVLSVLRQDLGQAEDNLARARAQQRAMPTWKSGNGESIDAVIAGYQEWADSCKTAIADVEALLEPGEPPAPPKAEPVYKLHMGKLTEKVLPEARFRDWQEDPETSHSVRVDYAGEGYRICRVGGGDSVYPEHVMVEHIGQGMLISDTYAKLVEQKFIDYLKEMESDER